MSLNDEQRHAIDEAARQVLAELAKESEPYAQRWCVDVPNHSNRGHALRHRIEQRLATCAELNERDFKSNEFVGRLRGLYFEYLACGLIVPSGSESLGEAVRDGWFHFTERGVATLAPGAPLHITQPGSLRRALMELNATGAICIETYELDLLADAQECWHRGLHRAAAVLMGLANESRCMALVDAVCAALPAPRVPNLSKEFAVASSDANHFALRWYATLALLNACGDDVRRRCRGTPARQLWEGVPGVLQTLGDAVRLTRNTAAHEPSHEFGRSGVGLLLAAMPTQIERVDGLRRFFELPPVNLPAL